MAKERIVPGTATFARYGFGKLKGIEHYGVTDGCYKVGIDYAPKLESIGYQIVKRGTGYCYARAGRR